MSEVATINIAAFQKATPMAGPGLRDAVWVQGCRIRCPGCANQAYLPHQPRRQLTVSRLLTHFRTRVGKIDGVSFLGGEPTEQAQAVAEVLAGVKELGLSTVLFSGRLLRDLERDRRFKKLLCFTDLLIDGPYIHAQRDLSLRWRGSRNQRLHRLSDYFSAEDLVGPGPTGEIRITATGLFFNGIGTQNLL